MAEDAQAEVGKWTGSRRNSVSTMKNASRLLARDRSGKGEAGAGGGELSKQFSVISDQLAVVEELEGRLKKRGSL
jgi:hypothetical protein